MTDRSIGSRILPELVSDADIHSLPSLTYDFSPLAFSGAAPLSSSDWQRLKIAATKLDFHDSSHQAPLIIMPLGQLHAGQLRFHDFTLLREAREQRRLRNQLTIQPLLFTTPSSTTARFFNSAFSRSSNLNSILPSPAISIPQRTFLTNLRQDLHLKSLERIANSQPQDVHAQYEFLSNLSQSHPEAVIERFEHYKEFAVDERIALLYLNALSRTGNQNKFGLKRFVERLKQSGGAGGVSTETIAALQELSHSKSVKGELANRASKVLSGGSLGGGAMASGGGMFSMSRGNSPNSPLFVQTYNPLKTRDMLFTLARQVLVAFIVVSALTVVFTEQGLGRGGMGAMGNGKHIQEAEGSEVRFDDVKGVTEAKAELEEIVLYLKDPDRFTRLGGKLPRGLLLTGPPGTGKTLLAKAIAGEAGVPFFFSSGSQFEEVYVGLGAKRIRELFEAAKQKSPSIIFIDEIDAVGGTRKLKDQSALKMTLNELLVQMDGFEENNGIIVIGATNFAESLDSALLRPGRFDKHVAVPLPDVGGRKEILDMYAAKTKISDDVDLGILARGTTGFSGADLYNLMNQAALKASVDGLEKITMEVFEWAKDKIIMGAERKSAVITPETAKCTAYHEAGHALVGVLTDGSRPIHKATIVPRGQSLGMVTSLPEGDQTSMSWKQMIAYMDMCMGGRVAEELIFGEENVTSGASSDIEQATRIARNMVTKFGFSDDVGIVYYGGETGQEHASAKTRSQIDEEVKKLTGASYERAKFLLKKHSKEHKLLAETLLEYETLTGDEVRDLVLNGKKPQRPVVNNEGGSRGDQALVSSKSKQNRGEKSRLAGLADKIRSRKEEGSQ
eukprot:CCRYP_017499-RB/>CCRYP_017499-RB protein AED:0.19 eAED:0.19 QI:0/1/0.8/1/0.75/0.6/5/323/843